MAVVFVCDVQLVAVVLACASAAQNCVREAGLMPCATAAHLTYLITTRLCARLSPLHYQELLLDAQRKRLAGNIDQNAKAGRGLTHH